MLKAIIFDFDGLIIETEGPILQAWQELYQAHDQVLTFADWQAAIGTQESPFDPRLELEKRTGKKLDWESLDQKRRSRELELVSQAPLLPGVNEYLRQAKEMDLKLGLASSSYHDWVDHHLNERGLWAYFQTIQCADDVELTKPDPALYVQAVQQLGINPHEALALEDSPHGAVAAKEAGLFCVVVPTAITRQMTFEAGDLHINSLSELPFESLLHVFNHHASKNGKQKP